MLLLGQFAVGSSDLRLLLAAAGAESRQTRTTRYPKLVPLTLEIPVLYVKHLFIFNKVNVLCFLKSLFCRQQLEHS